MKSATIEASGDRFPGITDNNVWKRLRAKFLFKININVNAAEGVGLKTLTGWLFWLHTVGLLMSVVGFMTVYWYYDSEMWMGIWNTCKPYDFPLLYGYLVAVRVFLVAGYIFYTLALVTVVMYSFFTVEACDPTTLAMCALVFSFTSSIAIMMGVILYSVQVRRNLGISFGTAVFSGVCSLLAGIMGVCVKTGSS